MATIDKLLDMVAPHYCLSCSEPGDLLCQSCQFSIVIRSVSSCYGCNGLSSDYRTCDNCYRRASLRSVYTAIEFDELSKELIYCLKFNRSIAAAKNIAQLVYEVLPIDRFDVITHLPTATNRVRRRGYDQAELIAKQLGKIADLPARRLLKRLTQHRQVGSSRLQRQENAPKMFLATDQTKQYRRILIVDDIMSTGASLEAASKALKSQGAYRVEAAVLSRS